MDTYIPGDCLPGLLDGWCGPVETWCRAGSGSYNGFFALTVFDGREYQGPSARNREYRLDTRREEVRDRVARVIARALNQPVDATSPGFGLAAPISDEDPVWYLYDPTEIGRASCRERV